MYNKGYNKPRKLSVRKVTGILGMATDVVFYDDDEQLMDVDEQYMLQNGDDYSVVSLECDDNVVSIYTEKDSGDKADKILVSDIESVLYNAEYSYFDKEDKGIDNDEIPYTEYEDSEVVYIMIDNGSGKELCIFTDYDVDSYDPDYAW